jgi:hypothetical protein
MNYSAKHNKNILAKPTKFETRFFVFAVFTYLKDFVKTKSHPHILPV